MISVQELDVFKSERLTPRERQVLQAYARGLRKQEIADVLGISLNTVRTHVDNALGKLNVHTLTHAVAIAMRAGVIE